MSEKDEIIYRRFLMERSESDLRILLERYRESLILFLLGYVGNEADAEELMMDAYAVIASGTASFSGRSSFKTWLFGIARNRARMFLRKQRGFFFSLDDTHEKTQEEDAEQNTPELVLLREDQNRQLYLALKTLPAAYRQVLYLVYFEDMPPDEAALVMGKNKKQIYNLLERGRKALKEALERMGFDYAQYR